MFSPIRAIRLLAIGAVTVAGMTAGAAVGQSRSIVEVMDTVSIGVAAGAPTVGDCDTVAQAGSGESHDATVGADLSMGTIGPDLIVGDLQSVLRFGRVGDITAYTVGTVACNIGDERVSWVAPTGAHPVWVQGMYRLAEGRFEQIGMSWAVHGGFHALSQTFCWPGTGDICGDPTDGSQLGVHCSDSYSHYLNGLQSNMSLRSDIDAHSGYFPYPWEGPDWEDLTYKRIQVHDADLDPDLNPGALFFIEAQYIAADEAAAGNGNNSASYRRLAVYEQSPNIYHITPASETQREQPAIRAWQDTDSSVVETDAQVPGEGLFILAVKVTDLLNGFWHYEYALQNISSDRSAGSFSVPLPSGAVLENVGFHDVDYHSGEIYDSTDWEPVVDNSTIRWSTETYDNDPNANALRFATIYNLRFAANVEPAPSIITIDLFKPGFPDSITVPTTGPSLDFLDCNDNDIEDVCDIECGVECDPPCGMSADCNGNYIPDECEPDCNANGIADECDITEGRSNDCNLNTVPDECEPDCDGDGIPDDCDTFEDTDGDGIYDCFDMCPETTPVGACVCPALGECCWPSGICFGGYPRASCLELGGTPDCMESPCRDGCLIGDRDSDGDRDLRDCAALQRCYSGPYEDPAYESLSGDCALHFDFDEDDDVDLNDFGMFQENHVGP